MTSSNYKINGLAIRVYQLPVCHQHLHITSVIHRYHPGLLFCLHGVDSASCTFLLADHSGSHFFCLYSSVSYQQVSDSELLHWKEHVNVTNWTTKSLFGSCPGGWRRTSRLVVVVYLACQLFTRGAWMRQRG